MTRLDQLPAFKQLRAHAAETRSLHLHPLFAEDRTRGERLTAEGAGIFLDYSKNRITTRTLELLLALAEQARLMRRRAAMFASERINSTEDRPVLHVALRMPRGTALKVDGRDVVADVNDVLDGMSDFCARIRSGQWKGQRVPFTTSGAW